PGARGRRLDRRLHQRGAAVARGADGAEARPDRAVGAPLSAGRRAGTRDRLLAGVQALVGRVAGRPAGGGHGAAAAAQRGDALGSWLMHSPPRPGLIDPAPGAWVAEAQWPSPNIAAHSLHLSPGTLGNAPGAGSVRIATPETLGLAGGAWCPYGYDGDVPPD